MPYVTAEIKELRAERVKLGTDARAILAKAKDEGRKGPDTDEQATIDRMYDKAEELRKQIEAMEKADGLINELDKPEPRKAAVVDDLEPEKAEEAKKEIREIGKGVRDSEEYLRHFRRYITASSPGEANLAHMRALEVLESRDAQVDNYTQAGALVPSEQMVSDLIKALDDATYLRQWARGFQVRQAQSLGAPKRTAALSSFAWGAELASPTSDSTLAYGKRNLHPHNASGLVKASLDFMRQSTMSPEAVLRDELARDGGELIENGMLTGTGAQQPLGVFTASADGISTSRDVSTGNTTTEVTVQGFREAKYSIKQPYWPRLRVLGSRTLHKQVYGMEDGNGRPLFVESLRVGEPDRVMGMPIFISEFAPSTFTTGLYVGIIGDWQTGYWYADAYDMTIQRLNELYAATNQVGFIARLKFDGMPVLEECWARIKLA